MCGFGLALRPLNQQPLLLAHAILICGADPYAREPRRQRLTASLPPGYIAPHLRRQAARYLQHGYRLVPRIPLHSCARTPTSGLRWHLHRLMFSPPDTRRFTNPQHVVQFLTPKPIAKVRLSSIPRVGQHDSARNIVGQRSLNLFASNLPLGSKLNLLRHARFPTTGSILGPFLWQVQPIVQRHTAVRVGQGQAHRYLTILRLAQAPAVLPRHTHRMLTRRYTRGVIHSPPAPLILLQQRRSALFRPYTQNRMIVPVGSGHVVDHRLMRRAHIFRTYTRRHRLDALSLTG